jgi:hypothetical protein
MLSKALSPIIPTPESSDPRMATKPSKSNNKFPLPETTLTRFEHRSQKVISRHKFAWRMIMAIGLWGVLTVAGLAIGMIGYAFFEGMSFVDAFVNAAMILSGMGPLGELKTTGGKIFAGSYAIFSGLIIVIATGFVLAPVFHRVLHRFHVEQGKQD